VTAAVRIPEGSLVVLIGPSGSGKSTFAGRHFLPTEVLSSDACRAMVCDDQTQQSVTKQAFEILHFIAARRLSAGRRTVIDATNVLPEARRPLLRLAREHGRAAVAIVFDLPEDVCARRNAERAGRDVGADVVRRHAEQLRRSMGRLGQEGFVVVYVLTSQEDVDAATVESAGPPA